MNEPSREQQTMENQSLALSQTSVQSCLLMNTDVVDVIAQYLTWKERFCKLISTNRHISLSPVCFTADHIHLDSAIIDAIRKSNQLRRHLSLVQSISLSLSDVPLPIRLIFATFPALRSLLVQLEDTVLDVEEGDESDDNEYSDEDDENSEDSDDENEEDSDDQDDEDRINQENEDQNDEDSENRDDEVVNDLKEVDTEHDTEPVNGRTQLDAELENHITQFDEETSSIKQMFTSLAQLTMLETLIVQGISESCRFDVFLYQPNMFKQIAQVSSLRTLLISDVSIAASCVQVLCCDLPNLTHLNLGGCSYYDGENDFESPTPRPLSQSLRILCLPLDHELSDCFLEQLTPYGPCSLEYFGISGGDYDWSSGGRAMISRLGTFSSLTSLHFDANSLDGLLIADNQDCGGELPIPELRCFAGPWDGNCEAMYDQDELDALTKQLVEVLEAYHRQLRFVRTEGRSSGDLDKQVLRTLLSCTELRCLNFSTIWENDYLSDDFMKSMRPLTHLHTLSLDSLPYNSKYLHCDHLSRLLPLCPHVEDLHIELFAMASSQMFKVIGQCCRTLRRLALRVHAENSCEEVTTTCEAASSSLSTSASVSTFPRLEFLTVDTNQKIFWSTRSVAQFVQSVRDAPYLRLIRLAGLVQTSDLHYFDAFPLLGCLQLNRMPTELQSCFETPPVVSAPFSTVLCASDVGNFVDHALQLNERLLGSEAMWNEEQHEYFARLFSMSVQRPGKKDYGYCTFRQSMIQTSTNMQQSGKEAFFQLARQIAEDK